MNRRRYRAVWLRQLGIYQKVGFMRFSRAIRLSMQKMPWENITVDNYEFIIKEFITNKPIVDAYNSFYESIGLLHGKKIGRAINREQKMFNPFSFESGFKTFIKNWVINNSGKKITSVRESLIEELIKTFAEGIERGDSISTIARNIRKTVNNGNFYRWQALRIARTEATGAANLGASKAAEESGVELTKEWISTIDKRTRRKPKSEYDHLHMDGVVVDEKENFNVDGDLVQYPGDSKGEAGNIINCRCTVAYLIKRDSAGHIIFKPAA